RYSRTSARSCLESPAILEPPAPLRALTGHPMRSDTSLLVRAASDLAGRFLGSHTPSDVPRGGAWLAPPAIARAADWIDSPGTRLRRPLKRRVQADCQQNRCRNEKHQGRNQERSYQYPNHDHSPFESASPRLFAVTCDKATRVPANRRS